jgi:hypothetical protein
MACEDYGQLRKEFEFELQTWTYLVSPNYSPMRDISARKSKQLATEALGRMNEVRRQMFRHRQFCAECHRTETTITPKARSANAGSAN